MKNLIKKIIVKIAIFILVIQISSNTWATDIDKATATNDDFEEYLKNANYKETSEIIEIYDELTEKYSNKEIANMIQENKNEIISQTGIDEDTLNKGTSVLSTLNTEETRKILKEDLNIDEIKQKLDEGYTINQIVNYIQQHMSTSKKISIVAKLLLASSIVKTALITILAIVIYKIIIRWIMFTKAGKHGFASIVPIYSEIVYLDVCGISPWWILTLFIPVFGLLIYGIVKIISKFTLAESFDRSTGFGFGLLLLKIIFESILAFNKNIKYVEYEE